MKLLLAFALSFSSFANAQHVVELSVHFDKASAVPNMPEMAMLNEIAQHQNSGQLRFSVVGHTDSNGSEKFNHELSKERTITVVNHLLLSGIMPYNIIFEYHGEDCSFGEQTEQSLAESRRVDIHVSNVGNLDDGGFAGLYSEENFQRPLPRVIPDAEVFEINTLEDNCIETASGTLIDIPAIAFMDAYGRPISGEVEVSYQEFNDPFSIFLSGITMKYDENGAVENLESAGMFSLLASQRNRPVELRADKPINVEFVSTSADDNFDFFFLDPSGNAWDKLGEAPIREDDSELISQVENMSAAVINYLGNTDYLSAGKASRTTLEEHFQNLEYMHGRPIASYYRFLRKGNEKESKQFRKIWRKQATISSRLLPRSRKNDESTVHFNVFNRAGNRQNAEWNRFNLHTWEYAGGLNRKELKKLLGKKRFHNLRVRYNQDDETVVLELKNLDSIVHIPVKKITVINASADYQKRMWGEFAPAYHKARMRNLNRWFELKHRTYARSLQRQERNVQRDADRFDRRAQRDYDKERKRIWRETKDLMTDAEGLMSFTQWTSYTEDRSNMLQEYYIKQEQGQSVVRSLIVGRMGIYNCDRIIELKSPQEVKPRFVLADGSAINWNTAYLFDEKLNGVITYDRMKMDAITISPKNLKMILVADMVGRTYRLNESEVIAMNRSKKAQRIMHVTEFEQSIRSLEEMREMLGLAKSE